MTAISIQVYELPKTATDVDFDAVGQVVGRALASWALINFKQPVGKKITITGKTGIIEPLPPNTDELQVIINKVISIWIDNFVLAGHEQRQVEIFANSCMSALTKALEEESDRRRWARKIKQHADWAAAMDCRGRL